MLKMLTETILTNPFSIIGRFSKSISYWTAKRSRQNFHGKGNSFCIFSWTNLVKSLKSFPPCIRSHLYSFALRFLYFKRNLLCISSNSRNLLHFTTVQLLSQCHCKGERRKTWWKTIPLSLWFKKSLQKPQFWELSRLCQETSTKLYVHELGFWTAFCKNRPLEGFCRG